MKKILLVFVLLLGACSSSPVNNDNESTIELTPNEGTVKKIAMQDVFEKMDNKETFVVLLSQTYCNACLKFFMLTDSYTEEIGLTLWDIILDDEPTSEEENLEMTNERFGHFSATPSIYYIENGEVKDSLCSDSVELTLETYQQFLTENNIIK